MRRATNQRLKFNKSYTLLLRLRSALRQESTIARRVARLSRTFRRCLHCAHTLLPSSFPNLHRSFLRAGQPLWASIPWATCRADRLSAIDYRLLVSISNRKDTCRFATRSMRRPHPISAQSDSCKGKNAPAPPTPKDICLNLPCTLRELYCGVMKSVSYERAEISPDGFSIKMV